MSTRKIGIITCANCTQDLDCCSIGCLGDLHRRSGSFSRYGKDERIRLAGVISCSGCPTLAYPEKILRKVHALTAYGIKDIHLANCMLSLCPYAQKYAALIRSRFPELTLVEGTHEEHISCGQFRDLVKTAFERGATMPDIILDRL